MALKKGFGVAGGTEFPGKTIPEAITEAASVPGRGAMDRELGGEVRLIRGIVNHRDRTRDLTLTYEQTLG